MHVGKNQGYRVPGPRDPTGCIEFRASSCTFWLLSLLCPTAISPVSPLSVPFALFFSPVSSSLSSLLFHAWPATENRELSALPRPYALSLFLGLVVTHTGEKRRANRQPTTRKWRPVETSPGLVNPALFRSDYSIPFDMKRTLPVLQSSAKYQRIVIDTRVNSSFDSKHVNTLTATRVFTEISVRGHACCCARATPIDISVMRVNHIFNKPIFILLRS